MTLATALAILGLVNGLLGVAKAAPGVLDEAKSLLAKVEPYLADLPWNVREQFDALKAQL